MERASLPQLPGGPECAIVICGFALGRGATFGNMERTVVGDRGLYLDLLKRTLTRSAFPERYREWVPWTPWKRRIVVAANRFLARANVSLVRQVNVDADAR